MAPHESVSRPRLADWLPRALDGPATYAQIARVRSSFDGAGDPYRGSSYRGWIVVGIVCIIVIAAIWFAFSEALDMLPAGTPTVSSPLDHR